MSHCKSHQDSWVAELRSHNQGVLHTNNGRLGSHDRIHQGTEEIVRCCRQQLSCLKIVHSLLAFPLGTLYFVFLVAGMSPGFGLVIILLGIPLLGLEPGDSN